LRLIDDRIIDLQIIKGGFIMTQKAFGFLLKEHPELRQELEILQKRKFRLERLLFKTA